MARTTKKKPAAASGIKKISVEAQVVVSEHTPEIYVDGFTGVIVKEGVIKFNFFSDILNASNNTVERRIVSHMTMPLTVLKSVTEAMDKILVDLIKDGKIVQPPDDSQESK